MEQVDNMASNFNDTTPAAPAGSLNVKWQTDGSGNDSAYYKVPFALGVFAPGLGVASQKLVRIVPTSAVKFLAGAAASVAVASAASTGTVVFSIYKNGGSAFATITFTSSATGVWAQASDATFNGTSDLLEIDGPVSPDATLADVGITFAGFRTA